MNKNHNNSPIRLDFCQTRHVLERSPKDWFGAGLTVVVIAAVAMLLGCGDGRGDTQNLNLKSPAVIQHCAEDRNRPCRENCRDEGKFGYCYKEKGHDPKAIDINWHCYAIHLGKTCKPCENIYSMNFAGAMSQVSCEEFYAFLELKNNKCNNCLERQDHL